MRRGAAGRVLTGGETIRIDELVVAMPLAWLACWVATRGFRAGVALVALAGLLA